MITNPIEDKSYKFALNIIEVYKQQRLTDREFDLSEQLLRSETSIGTIVSTTKKNLQK